MLLDTHNNLVEPEKLQEVEHRVQDSQKDGDYKMMARVSRIRVVRKAVEEAVDREGVEQDAEGEEQKPEQVQIDLEEDSVTLLLSYHHSSIVDKRCRDFCDV